jgi:hypothetical protein
MWNPLMSKVRLKSNLESGEERYVLRIGAPDSKIPALSFPYTYYIEILAGLKNLGIRRGAKSFQMRTNFIKQNLNFEKGAIRKIYKTVAAFRHGLTTHTLTSQIFS